MGMYVEETEMGLHVRGKPFWYHEDGSPVDNDEVFIREGVYPVVSQPPEINERFQYVQENGIGEWVKRDNTYYVTFSVYDKPPKMVFNTALTQAKHAALSWYETTLENGYTYEFSSGVDIVQVRPSDKINLIGLKVEAIEKQQSGGSVVFRAGSNKIYDLLPQQAIQMADGALVHMEEIQHRYWALKDKIAIIKEDYENDKHSLSDTIQALDGLLDDQGM